MVYYCISVVVTRPQPGHMKTCIIAAMCTFSCMHKKVIIVMHGKSLLVTSTVLYTFYRSIAFNIIAERISARHWIADCGPGIGSCMYVCMYVRHAFGMQLRLHACAMATVCMSAYCITCAAAYIPGS